MPDTNDSADNGAKTSAQDASVLRPHGEQQSIKMEILDMIHSGESPFDILYHVAKYLEDVSGEPGYAKYVEDQIRSIYGCALQHEKPLQNELAEVEARLKRIEASYENPSFTEDEHIRIGFAIEKHKKNIERLRTLIHEAKANHTSMNIKKD